jgi:hypothetical protein
MKCHGNDNLGNDLLDNSDELCHNSVACMTDWNKLRPYYEKNGQYRTALTHLGGLSGAIPSNTDEGSIYGAAFMPVKADNPPWYEVWSDDIVIAPWLAQRQEATYMNRTKVLNEPPVETYKELILSPIPQEKYEKYEPIINTLEAPSWTDRYGKPEHFYTVGAGINDIDKLKSFATNDLGKIQSIIEKDDPVYLYFNDKNKYREQFGQFDYQESKNYVFKIICMIFTVVLIFYILYQINQEAE